MTYRYLDHITWADTAFEARASSLEELFREACDATLGVMIQNFDALQKLERREVHLKTKNSDEADAAAAILHELLERIIFFKDADLLLLRLERVQLSKAADGWSLSATLAGEPIDPDTHELLTDVKAVTHHQFEVRRDGSSWVATVVLDV